MCIAFKFCDVSLLSNSKRTKETTKIIYIFLFSTIETYLIINFLLLRLGLFLICS